MNEIDRLTKALTPRTAQQLEDMDVDAETEAGGACEVEWERPKSAYCKPHKCDLLTGHEGPHVCDCGWQRRRMRRDEPDE